VDQTYPPDLAWSDRLLQVDLDTANTLVWPIGSLVHIRRSLYVAIGIVNFDIQVVVASAKVVISGCDLKLNRCYRAPAPLL
jgi:hypothetical protein